MGIDVNERGYNAWRAKSNRFSKRMLNPEILIDRVTAESKGIMMRGDKTVQDFNARIKAWGDDVKSDLVMSIAQWIEKDEHLSESLRINYYNGKRKASGDKPVDRIGFSFREEGVYVHFGVGNGYSRTGDKVSKWGKSNGFNRQPKPWFNSVLQQQIPYLDEIVREYTEGLSINAMSVLLSE
ncbi:MAG: hypothetical protein RR837_11775 [Bacteroidales bacterium]